MTSSVNISNDLPWKSIASVFFIVVFSTSIAYSRNNKDEVAILKVFRKEERAWNAHDIEGYVALYAPLDSSRMILSKGVAAGKNNILAFYKKYWPEDKMGSLKLDSESMECISKKYYFVTGYFHVTYPEGRRFMDDIQAWWSNGKTNGISIRIIPLDVNKD